MAAFVPDFQHDVFVSYAHLDNRPQVLGKDESGWVSTLKAYLQNFLDPKLGKPADIWMDLRGLRGNELLTPEIQESVKAAAVLVVVLSQGYLESAWCAQERESFLISAGGEQAAAGRIFVIHRDETPRGQWPAAFADLVGYKFFEKNELTGDTTTLGVPQPHPDEKAYHVRLNRLVADMAQQLKRLRSEPARPDPPAQAPSTNGTTAADDRPTVFLAECSNDLLDVREEVNTFLQQSGLRVLPVSFYSRTVSAFIEAMDRDLSGSSMFVQLLGPYPPVRTEDLPSGYEGLQLERARACAKPVLRWRRPDLDLLAIRDQEYRRFLEVDVAAMDMEDFKRHILETERRLLVQQTISKKTSSNETSAADPFVLVNADRTDLAVAEAVAEKLVQFDIGFDIEDGNRVSLDDLTQSDDYDGLLVVYGECSPEWVHQRVRELRKVEQTKKHRAPVCAVYLGPPIPKRLKCRYRSLHVIDDADPTKFHSYAQAVISRDVAE